MAEKQDPVLDIGLTGRKKVLVAEDEQNIASLIEDWLSDVYEVILAHNGAAALQKAKWNKPDVLILDIMMPDTGGYEVVCALQGDAATAKIPVIVMTAKNFDDSTVKLIKAERNVFGFLNKPFKPDEIKKQILQVMAGQRTFAAPPGRSAPAPHSPGQGAAVSARPPGAAPAPRPAAPPVPAARPPAPPPPTAALPPVPPTPPFVLPPAPAPIPAPASFAPPPPLEIVRNAPPPAPAPPPPAIVRGFPEIVPTSAVQPPAPLPPFLKPAIMVPPPAAPLPPVPAAPPPPAGPVIEPLSAMPPAPQIPLELEERPSPVEVPTRAEIAAPALSPPRPRRPSLSSKPAVEDDREEEAGSAVFLRLAWPVFKKAAKWAVLAAVVIVAAETSCRWTEKALGREIFVPPLHPARNARLPHVFPLSADWRQGDINYSVNEWGLRGKKVELLKGPNTLRILLLGGSALFGENLRADQTVGGHLEALLSGEEGRLKYEVINGGAWGYSPGEQWAFYETELAQLKPEVVVWLCEDRAGGAPSSQNLKDMAQGTWMSSALFKGSHFVHVLMRRKLSAGASSSRTDFLSLVQPAEKFVRQNDAKFLYAVFPDRDLDAGEWSELPEKGRLETDGDLRLDYLRRTTAAQQAVARLIYEKVRALKIGGAGRKDSTAKEPK